MSVVQPQTAPWSRHGTEMRRHGQCPKSLTENEKASREHCDNFLPKSQLSTPDHSLRVEYSIVHLASLSASQFTTVHYPLSIIHYAPTDRDTRFTEASTSPLRLAPRKIRNGLKLLTDIAHRTSNTESKPIHLHLGWQPNEHPPKKQILLVSPPEKR